MPHTIDYPGAIAELRRARSVAITTHTKPDGDALGSIAALRRWLVMQGKSVQVVVPTPPPPKYLFLDPEGAVKTAGRDVDVSRIPKPDLVCVLDTCTWLQLENVKALVADSGAPVLAIDHHRTHDDLADFLLSDPRAAATAVLLYRLLKTAKANIDQEMATGLFVGLALDTDWFRLPNVDGEVMHLAGALVEAGAKPHEIHDLLYQNDDLTKVLLRARAIETMHAALDGRAMVMHLTQAMFREIGADIGDTENLINECMKVRGARVGLMLVEAEGDEVRVSLRSRPPVDVLRVAEKFGGGGHHRAAGARARGAIDQVEAAILPEVAESLAIADAAPRDA